jgi:hypothetical protein
MWSHGFRTIKLQAPCSKCRSNRQKTSAQLEEVKSKIKALRKSLSVQSWKPDAAQDQSWETLPSSEPGEHPSTKNTPECGIGATSQEEDNEEMEMIAVPEQI